LIELFKKRKRKLSCCFIDFKKAFDSVWHTGLWIKLLSQGIKGKCLQVLQSMYNGIKSCVSVRNSQSDFFPCCIGVRQGEILSPVLFSLYINDIDSYLATNDCPGLPLSDSFDNMIDVGVILYVLMYADDTVLLASNAKHLQTMLDLFTSYRVL
jgi:hypothetical protein